MTALLLDPRTADKLAKLLGMLGSAHGGERAAAAAKADELIRSQGLAWAQIVLPKRDPQTIPEKIAFALANIDLLSMWERGFIYTVNGKRTLSPKQLGVLDQIVDKVRACAEGG